MSPIQFKFSKPPDGPLRRVTFQDKPSWNELAAKIHALYNVPVPNIGVSYVDSDGDEVTLSSEEELQDFYQYASAQRKDGPLTLVKLTIRDLETLRNDKPLPETPRTASGLNYRNTFGRSAPVLFEMEVDDGWQPIPSGIAGLFTGAIPAVGGSPHAFVEVLDSDADTSQPQEKQKEIPRESTFTDTSVPDMNPSLNTDKGKGRARSADLSHSDAETISSNQSVVAEESGNKHPIHIYNVHHDSEDHLFGVTRSRSRSATATAPRTPTPKGKTPPAAATAAADAQADDPPLPDLDNMSAPPTNIAHDVANLFSTLSGILASHPELSEGIRNIVRNASNGTYWQAHHDTVVRAAEEIRRSALIGADEMRQVAADSRRAAEEAAGRRVADALGNVIRVIADITGGAPHDAHAHTAAAGNEPATSTPVAERDPYGSHRRFVGDPWGFGSPRGRGGFGGRGRGGHGSLRSHYDSIGSWGTFGSRWGEWGSAPPRGHHPFAPPFPPHSRPERAAGPPPPPGPPPHLMQGHHLRRPRLQVLHLRRPRPQVLTHHHRSPALTGLPAGAQQAHLPIITPMAALGSLPSVATLTRVAGVEVHVDWADTVPGLPPPPPPPPPAPPAPASGDAEVTMYGASPVESPESAKKALQEAKERYLAEKERYRRIREERKKRRMNASTDSEMREVHDSPISPHPQAHDPQEPTVRPAGGPSTTPLQRRNTVDDQAQIISNARGPFPQLQLFNIPRRSNTVHGTGHARNVSSSSNAGPAANARAVNAITARLNDMGFTASKYPALASKVEARVPRSGEVSQARQDTIVGEIVDELVQKSPSPRQAQPSGSGSRAT
ncbi:hypothetical protein C8Q77DRAFT_1082041 [Trametes polyzona]|nr:hypothetical protein C8Q77DRAFT_1082041 [Trametes polyzona]